MANTKKANTLVKGDVILYIEDMPMQVDDVIMVGQSVAIFYFTGREHTTLNVEPGHTFTVLTKGETWCEGVGEGSHGIVSIIDQGQEDADGYDWCALSCGCIFYDDSDFYEDE